MNKSGSRTETVGTGEEKADDDESIGDGSYNATETETSRQRDNETVTDEETRR